MIYGFIWNGKIDKVKRKVKQNIFEQEFKTEDIKR